MYATYHYYLCVYHRLLRIWQAAANLEFEFLFVGVAVQLIPVPQCERSRNKLSKENETLIPILKSHDKALMN